MLICFCYSLRRNQKQKGITNTSIAPSQNEAGEAAHGEADESSAFGLVGPGRYSIDNVDYLTLFAGLGQGAASIAWRSQVVARHLTEVLMSGWAPSSKDPTEASYKGKLIRDQNLEKILGRAEAPKVRRKKSSDINRIETTEHIQN